MKSQLEHANNCTLKFLNQLQLLSCIHS